MMESTKREALEDSDGASILSKEVEDVAAQNGINMLNIVSCQLTDNGYHTLDCLQELEAGESILMSVFNPNVQSLHGLFLTIERHLSNFKTSVL